MRSIQSAIKMASVTTVAAAGFTLKHENMKAIVVIVRTLNACSGIDAA